MSKIQISGVNNSNDYVELIRMFVPADDIIDVASQIILPEDLLNPAEKKEEIKKYIYNILHNRTGKSLKWGTLTGVKPLKLYNNILARRTQDYQKDEARQILKREYLVEDSKIKLLENIYVRQKKVLEAPKKNQVAVYIGIPFCPTRCTYCSFTSNQKDQQEIKRYLTALYKEMDYVSKEMVKSGLTAETIYVGGGTPTTLTADELKSLVQQIKTQIPAEKGFEFTVEAGRPDTIDEEKLEVLRKNGVERISINPQTMKEKSLRMIGRDHTTKEIVKAFEMARNIGFDVVNTDLIAGLPGENEEDFKNTLNEIAKFDPENVTVHTLALKKSSKLVEKLMDAGEELTVENDNRAENMVECAKDFLQKRKYMPYYIYRQKYMVDNLENVGYAKEGTECVYNIRIMEEKQTIIAMGAGGSTKMYFPEEDRIERIFNVSNYEIYIERIDEMIKRKSDKLFT